MLFYIDLPDHIHSVDGIAYMRVTSHFRSISNINTVGQDFDAKIWIQVKWMVDLPYESVDLEKEWRPMLEVVNNHGKIPQEQCVVVKKRKKPALTAIYSNHLLQGTFSEQFNLKQFPVDKQQLHVNFTMWGCPVVSKNVHAHRQDSEFHVKKLKLYTRPHKNVIFQEEFIPCEVWNIDSPILVWQGENQSSQNAGKVGYCTLEVSFYITRKTVFYFINIVIPTFIIVASSISSRMLPTFESQQSLVYTLMLTIVSLKFATVNFIPKTSVITYLDKYSIGSFIWVTIAALHNVVMYQLTFKDYDPSIVRTVDIAFIYWQLGAWVVFHVGIIMLLCGKLRDLISEQQFHVNKRKRSLVMTERHDKLGKVQTIQIDIGGACGKNDDDEKIDASNRYLPRSKSEEFPMVAFPQKASTMALSCINGTILDKNRAGSFNKKISHHARSRRSSLAMVFSQGEECGFE